MPSDRWDFLERDWLLWDVRTSTLVLGMINRCKQTGHDLKCSGAMIDDVRLALLLLANHRNGSAPNQIILAWTMDVWEDYANAF